MANIDDTSTGYNWETEGVYQIEKNDPVEGGVDGISNRQARQLARRTRDLHTRMASLKTQADGIIGQIKGGSVDVGYDTLLKLQNKLQAIESAINGDNDDNLIETLQEALGFINVHKGEIESLVNTFVKKTSVADNLTTTNPEYVLSANQGATLKELIEALTEIVNGKETLIGAQQKIDAALVSAKTYTDEAIVLAKNYADEKLAAAKTYADDLIARLVNQSPEALDTFKELADALGNDPNFATTILNKLGQKLQGLCEKEFVASSSLIVKGGVAYDFAFNGDLQVTGIIGFSATVNTSIITMKGNSKAIFSDHFFKNIKLDSITGTAAQTRVYTIIAVPYYGNNEPFYIVDCEIYGK